MPDSDPQFDDLPDAIVARLVRAERAQAIVDPRTDRAVVALAREHFAARPARAARSRLRWALPFSAAAAAVLVAILVVRPFGPGVSAADDVDGSGRVDILDAFALARLRAGGASGIGDDRIEALAERVVSLGTARAAP